jgi:prenyltransferase beta subunit
MTLLRRTPPALSAMVTVLLIYPACPAQAATARDPKFQPNLERTVRYLQNAQLENGGFAEPGGEPGSDFTAWVALALAAAGINPRDQTTAKQHWVGGHGAYTYLAEHAHSASLSTDFERELLVVDAAGTSPYDFGGVDLAGEILERQIATGSNAGAFPHEAGSTEPGMNDTIFAILALSPIKEPVVQHAVQSASEWVEAEQDCDDGWPATAHRIVATPCPPGGGELPGDPESEVDMTGAAIEALNAAGRHQAAQKVEQGAFEYLKKAQDANGGFPEEPGDPEPNVASTAWVVQAMWSAPINPEAWLEHSGLATEESLGYMASLQQEDGHIRWEQSQESNGMWMTAYVTPAFTGNPLPIPEVPYEPLPVLPPEEPVGNGDGGVSTNPGAGVIAGGGDGAPLFSRPQPGSKGHTPGGVRLLKDQHHDTTKHHRNPGPARKTPVPTATIASVHRPKKHDPVSHKGTGGVTLTGTGASGGGQSSGREVKGILIGAPADALEPGARGLRGAGAGDDRTSWLAIGIGVAIALLALAGSQLERRRPEVIL